jgi:hypothetical protein
MRSFFCFVLFGIFVKGYGQEAYRPTKVIPPSPTAASLGVYGDIPVSYYTGTANVSIPLYTLKTSQHSLPITLQYNCSGIKVAQDASWVGLGWSLSAGGVITRAIRGQDDFSTEGYIATGSLPPYDEDNDYEPGSDPNAAASADYFQDISRELSKDGDPDVFFYNFGSYSGKFVIGKSVNGKPIFMADRNDLEIKFEPNYSSEHWTSTFTGEWIVKTPEGYQYYFSIPEVSEDYYKSSELSNYSGLEPAFTRSYKESVNSWFLRLVKSPAGEEIEFTYDISRSLSLISTFQSRYDRTSSVQTNGPSMSNKYNYFNLSRQAIYDVLLKKIEFKNGYILFNTSRRSDIEPMPFSTSKPQKLSEVEVYNNNDELQNKFSFRYTYFNKNYNTSDSFCYKRLKLDTLIEYGRNGTAKNPYLFYYFNQDELPSKYSTLVDEWGFQSYFYSPVLTGELRPTLLPIVQTTTYNGPTTFEGTTRNSDSIGTYSKRGVLTSITYPTTGMTRFEYEPNEYRVAPYAALGSQQIIATAKSHYISWDDQLVDSFNIYGTDSVSFYLSAYPIADSIIAPSLNIGYLKNTATNTVIESFNLLNPSKVVVLSPGAYAIVIDQVYDYHVRMEAYYQSPAVTKYSRKGAGIRIKSVSNYNYDNSKINTTSYVYTENGALGGLSTGRLVYTPIKHYKRGVAVYTLDLYDFVDIGTPCASAEYLVRSSSSLQPLGFNSAQNQVTYDKVWVLVGENGEGGSTQYSYFNHYASLYQQPEIPSPSFPLNGRVISIETRNASGQKIKKIINEYTLRESLILKGVKILKPPQDNSLVLYYPEEDVKFYDNISEWWVLSSETDSSFFDDKVVITVKNSYYADSIYKQKTREEMTLSDGSVQATVFKYPQDFVSTSPYDTMVLAKHIISPVVEQISYKDTTRLESMRTSYYNWSGFYAPVTVESKRGWGAWKTRLRFYGYDNKGNLLSVSQENDTKASYVWGYNQTLPVIKAENITSAELNTQVGLALNALGYTGGINALDDFLTYLGDLSFSTQKSSFKIFNTELRNRLLVNKVNYSVQTYIPMIGMTSITDANNISTYYEFDNLGRLKLTRDNDGNINKTYKYNYRQ